VSEQEIYFRPPSPQAIMRHAGWIVPAVLLLIVLATSFYMVNTDAKGVVLRFGKFNRTAEPGLHFKLPFGIETVLTPQVERVFKAEFGFSTLKAGIKSTYGKKNLNESLMLCGDLSVAEVEWIVQFKIKDPKQFLFNVRNPQKVIRDTAESVMRSVVGNSSVDEVLSTRRVEINDQAQQKMQEILNTYNCGIQVVAVKLQDVNPPEPVKPAFNEVNAAQQDKEKLINKAKEEYNRVIPKARGQQLQMVKQAGGYAIDRTNTAKGDAERFSQVWAEYSRSKDVTRRRLYLESMSKILPKIEKKYIVDDQIKGLLPLMNLTEVK
jgi:modulator of FtsH protease HflK